MPRTRQRRSAINFQLPSSLNLNLSAASPLEVKLQPQPQSPSPFPILLRIVILLAILILIVGLAMFWNYVKPQVRGEQRYGSLTVTVSHPQVVAYGDENELEITVFNHGRQPVDETATLIFSDNPAIRFLQDEPTTIKLDKLPSGAGLTQKVKFGLLFPDTSTQPIIIGLAFGESGWCRVSSMTVTSFWYARTITGWLFNPNVPIAILSTLFAFLWEVFKQRATGGEAQ